MGPLVLQGWQALAVADSVSVKRMHSLIWTHYAVKDAKGRSDSHCWKPMLRRNFQFEEPAGEVIRPSKVEHGVAGVEKGVSHDLLKYCAAEACCAGPIT